MPSSPRTAPRVSPTIVSVSDGSSVSYVRESWNVGSRNLCSASLILGACKAPPIVASTASAPMATFIVVSHSAM